MQKSITYNRDTKDFDMFLDGEYIGSRASHHDAENELDRVASDRAAESASLVEQAVCGALDRLAQEHSQSANLCSATGDKAGATHERRAATSYTNALIEYRKGVRPQLLDSGAWLLPSRRAGEPPHIVRMDGDWVCDCKAFSSMHWPIALVIACEVAGDDLDRFDGGDVEEGDEAEEEDYSIQYEDVPYPHGIGNPDAAACRATMGRRLCAARSKHLEAA